MRAALSDVMTQAAYDHMLALAGSLADGLRSVIGRRQLPWCVTQVGARTEFQFFPQPPRNGSQAAGTLDAELGHLPHLGLAGEEAALGHEEELRDDCRAHLAAGEDGHDGAL